MLAEKYKHELPLLTAIKCQPCISVIMPFEPKMNSKAAIKHSLKIVTDKIKRDLNNNYTQNKSDELLQKLKNIIELLDYTTHKKSIAIYLSSEIEKVYYLDIEVQEKVIIDASFEIREILRNKKDEHEFLLLLISGKKEKIYFGSNDKLQLIVSNSARYTERDLPEPVSNFTDPAAIKETRLEQFLHYVDKGLSYIIKSYPLPLFVLATRKTMGYFKGITKHPESITGFIHGNFDDATEVDLRKTIESQLKKWSVVKESHLKNLIKGAQDNLKLATGIHDVWLQAKRRHKQLLVVEKNFCCPAFVAEKGETIYSNISPTNSVITKDVVDDIIEKVLENGGDVEFVDELKDYNQIALVD